MSDIILERAKEKVIVALDTDSLKKAMEIVKLLAGKIGMVKVGMELFTRGGPELIQDIQSAGVDVFLDLKFKDIPNTVAGAIRSVVALGVKLCTVHADGGIKMLKAATEAAEGSDLTILAVTVLTSMDTTDLSEIGYVITTPRELVTKLASLAKKAGIGGIVCSGQEVEAVRQCVGSAIVLVTPGVRFPEGDMGDQKRVVTPDQAIVNGADYIVVGRPITRAADSVAAARKFVQAIALGMAERSGG